MDGDRRRSRDRPGRRLAFLVVGAPSAAGHGLRVLFCRCVPDEDLRGRIMLIAWVVGVFAVFGGLGTALFWTFRFDPGCVDCVTVGGRLAAWACLVSGWAGAAIFSAATLRRRSSRHREVR